MSKIHYITYLGQEWGRGKLVEATCAKVRPYVDQITVVKHSRSPIDQKLLDELRVITIIKNDGIVIDFILAALDVAKEGDFIYWQDSDERPTQESLIKAGDYKEAGVTNMHLKAESAILSEVNENPVLDWVPSIGARFFDKGSVNIHNNGNHTHVMANPGVKWPNNDRVRYYHFKTNSAFMQSVFLFFLADPLNHWGNKDGYGDLGWNQECYEQWKPLQEKHNATLDVVGGWNMDRSVPDDVKDLFKQWHKNPDVPGHMRLIADYVFDLNMYASYPKEWTLDTFGVEE